MADNTPATILDFISNVQDKSSRMLEDMTREEAKQLYDTYNYLLKSPMMKNGALLNPEQQISSARALASGGQAPGVEFVTEDKKTTNAEFASLREAINAAQKIGSEVAGFSYVDPSNPEKGIKDVKMAKVKKRTSGVPLFKRQSDVLNSNLIRLQKERDSLLKSINNQGINPYDPPSKLKGKESQLLNTFYTKQKKITDILKQLQDITNTFNPEQTEGGNWRDKLPEGVTEEDVLFTAEQENMTPEEVLQQLGQ